MTPKQMTRTPPVLAWPYGVGRQQGHGTEPCGAASVCLTGSHTNAIQNHAIAERSQPLSGRNPILYRLLTQRLPSSVTLSANTANPLKLWRARDDSNVRPLPSEGSFLGL